MADDVEVLFGGDASGLMSTIEAVKNAISEIGGHAQEAGEESEGGFTGFIEKMKEGLESIEGVKKALEGFAELAAAAFAVHEIEEFVESMTSLGRETSKAMMILGMSAEQIAALQAMAAASGTSMQSLEMGFSRFARGLEEGSKSVKAGLATIGLSFEAIKDMSPQERIEAIARAFQELPDGPLKATAAMELFGRAGMNMLPVLAKLAEDSETFSQMAERAGTVLDKGMREKMEAVELQSTELGMAIRGIGITVFGEFGNVIQGTIKIITDWAEEFNAAAKAPGILKETLDALRDVIKLTVEVVEAFIIALEMLFNVVNLVLGGIEALGTGFRTLVEESLKPAAQVLADLETGFSKLMSGDLSGAAESFGKAFSENLFGDTSKAWDSTIDKMKESWNRYVEANRDAMKKWTEEYHTLEGDQEKVTTETGKMTEEEKKAAEAAAELRRKWEEVMGGVKDTGSVIDELNEKIKTLEEGLKAGLAAGTPTGLTEATGSAADLIKHFEGFESKAYWDVNHWRVGYGSDTMTDAAGKVTEVTKESTTTAEEANRDLARRVSEYTQKAADEIGEAWNKLSDRAKASVVSVMYNYGHLPAAVRDAARGSQEELAKSIEALDANKSRRAAEAANIRGDVHADESDAAKKKLDELYDKRTKEQEKAAGGTEAEKEKVKALEEEAKGKGDILKADEAQVAALEKQLSMYRTAEARAPIEAKLAEAKVKLQEDENKAKEAGLKLEEQKAKATGDPGKEHAAAIKLADARIADAKAKYGEDSAEYKKAVAEKEAAEQKYVSESSKLTKEQVDEEIKAVKSAAEEKRKALDDELSHKRISTSTYLADIKAVNAEEEADTKKLYDKEAELAGQTAAEKIAIKNKEADAVREINSKMAEENRKAANESEKEWQSAIGGIVSSFTSAMKGMITGHETFRQAMMKALEGVANKFLDIAEKMLTKWITNQLTMTAVQQTQTAVRAASETAASTAGMAANAGSILKAIFSSAGQAFAGVFGFLSPVMGPAAAGPAAAAESTVIGTGSALVSADIGMWRVPSDQLAMVHRAELIMPAAQADSFRAMLSGGNPVGAGGGMSGVSIHPSINMKVGAIDSGGFKSWFSANQRQIMTSMNASVRQGAHLGLKALT
jgi:GH24 family phage-related lysozyme (muramidase)